MPAVREVGADGLKIDRSFISGNAGSGKSTILAQSSWTVETTA